MITNTPLSYYKGTTPELKALNPNSDLNRYVWIQLDEITSFTRAKEYLYKLAAGVTMVVAGIAIVGLTVLAAVKAPYLVSIPLLFGGGVYKILYNKVFTPLLEKGQKAAKEYENLVAIQKIMGDIEIQNLDYFGYSKLLDNLEISTGEIQHQDELARLDTHGNSLKPLASLIGRLTHWTDQLEKVELKLKMEKQALSEKEGELRQPNLSVKKQKALRSKCREIKMKVLRLEQEQVLPIKLAAAYHRHVICNTRDLREFTDFGEPVALNYLDVLENAADSQKNDYFHYPEKVMRPPETKEWLLDTPVSEISKRIFTIQAA